MRRAALLLLTATIVLAGCNAQPGGSNAAAPEEAAVKRAGSLAGAFTDPAATIVKLNQFGYRLGEYKNGANGFTATGEPVFLSQSDAKNPNRGTVEVAGKDADAIDSITFTLAVTDEANAETATKRLDDNVRSFLFQFGVTPDEKLFGHEKGASGSVEGADVAYRIDRSPTPRRITVTFQRQIAPAPAETAAQNIQQP